MTETKYHFEQLQLAGFGEGVIFEGVATLVTGDARYDDSFVIESIRLHKAASDLEKPNRDSIGNESQMFFTVISAVLYDEKTVWGREAAMEWADAVFGNSEPQPMFKDRRGLRDVLVRGADLQAAE